MQLSLPRPRCLATLLSVRTSRRGQRTIGLLPLSGDVKFAWRDVTIQHRLFYCSVLRRWLLLCTWKKPSYRAPFNSTLSVLISSRQMEVYKALCKGHIPITHLPDVGPRCINFFVCSAFTGEWLERGCLFDRPRSVVTSGSLLFRFRSGTKNSSRAGVSRLEGILPRSIWAGLQGETIVLLFGFEAV